MKSKKMLDALLVLFAFAVITVLAIFAAICISPDCLGAAYHYQVDDALQECFVVKTPASGLKKELFYLEKIRGDQCTG